MALAPGTRLGGFEILGSLGSGGMGEVYRARDLRLQREVAVKVLPDSLVHDGERNARLEREARLLATLNCSHIAAIYGFEEADGCKALILELVEGRTLAERLASGALPVPEALAVARQMADALEAAHDKDIVHRDLKPANIKVTPDGVVKVLDFGLAKGTPAAASADLSHSPTITSDGTRAGVILGTAAYMSPEQERVLVVDKRTDIWAFGCVLYEMLTGRPAFGGDTVTDITAAILKSDPDWSAVPQDTPAHVRRVLPRLLQKDPRKRARDIADVRFELDLPIERVPSNAGPVSVRAIRGWRVAAVAAVALAATLASLLVLTSRDAAVAPMVASAAVVTQLTNYGENETAGALAPDGRTFAYVLAAAERSDIWVRQTAGGDPIRLTDDSASETHLTYSPDSETIYFTRLEAGEASIWRIGALGGNARKVLDNARAPSISRDGRQLAWLADEPKRQSFALAVGSVDGANRRILVPNIVMQAASTVAWSPDGQQLAYSTGRLFEARNLFVVSVADGGVRQITRFEKSTEGTLAQAWLPDGRHLVVSYWPAPGAQLKTDLGVLDIETGIIVRFTASIRDNFAAPSVSQDGSRLIVTASRFEREIWRVPDGPDPIANGLRAERMIDFSVDPMWTFITRDGRTLLYNSAMIGSRNVWTMPLERGARARQITSMPGDTVMHSSLSPDGSRVAFISSTTGNADVWVQHVDGSGLRQLTNDSDADAWPVWSPDGQTLMYAARGPGVNETRLVSATGGQPQKLIDGFFRGDWIARPDGQGTRMVTVLDNDRGIRVVDVETRTVLWEQLGSGGMPLFSADARSISASFQDGPGRQGIAVHDAATGARRVAVRFSEPFQFYFRASWIDNERAFAVNRYRTRSHIVMFDNFWSPPATSVR